MIKKAYEKDGKEIDISQVPDINRPDYYDKKEEPRVRLIAKKCKIKEPHFAIYNCNGESEWHKKWKKDCKSNAFDIEIPYEKGKRKIDSVWEYNGIKYAIEFQKSTITKEELETRDQDHRKAGYIPIWLIYSKENISYDEKNDIYTLDHPILKNIYKTEYIYIDTEDGIARIDTCQARIKINKFHTCQQFINDIKKGKILEWEKQGNTCTTVTIKQAGAGNGKTFTETKDLIDLRWDGAIYLTPQHSQKYEASIKCLSHEKDGWEEINGSRNINDSENQRVHSRNTDGKIRMFGTIDSFVCMARLLFPEEKRPVFDFVECPEKIYNNWEELDRILKNKKNLNWGGWPFKLSDNIIIICDEVQNADKYKILVLIKLCESITNWHLICIGDLLQSTLIEDNILNYFYKNKEKFIKNFPNVNFIEPDAVNEYKRGLKNLKLAEFINKVIGPDFKKYGLPEIFIPNQGGTYTEDVYVEIYENDAIIDNILDKVEKLLEQGDRHQDFLFLFLRTYISNSMANNFLDMYSSRFGRDTIYGHSSEAEGRIDLSKSEKRARLMSVIGSQGTGRKNVFIFDLSELNLKRCRTSSEKLKGASLLHVALTRSEERMFIYINKKQLNDPVTARIIKGSNSDDLKHKFKISTLDMNFDKDVLISSIKIPLEYIEKQAKQIKNIKGSIISASDFNYNIKRYELALYASLYERMRKSAILHEKQKDRSDKTQQITILDSQFKSWKVQITSMQNVYDKRTAKNYGERLFEKDCIIYIPSYNLAEKFKEEIEKFQRVFTSKNICLESNVMLSYIYVFLVKYFSHNIICFFDEFNFFEEILENQDENKIFIETFKLVGKNLDKFNMTENVFSDTSWYHNRVRLLCIQDRDENPLAQIRVIYPLSYNNYEGKESIYIYKLIPSFSGMDIDKYISEFILAIHAYKCKCKITKEDLPRTNNINFVLLSTSLTEPYLIKFEDVRNYYYNNIQNLKDSIIQQKNYADLLYDEYESTEGKNNREKCKKCENKLKTSTFYGKFFDHISREPLMTKEIFLREYHKDLENLADDLFLKENE